MEVAMRSEALLGERPRWDAATGRLLWVCVFVTDVGLSGPPAQQFAG